MLFLGLLVRCKDEPYVAEFVNYYLRQGVDHIHILDDDSNNDIYNDVLSNEKVTIIFDKNIIATNAVSKIYTKIRHDYTWLIYVDMDEYITTKKHISNTIRDELTTTFKNASCVSVPWVMMSCNSIEKNPASLLETNVYRWNHDKKHINDKSTEKKFRCRYNAIECKCIFRPKLFNNIRDHAPYNPIQANFRVVNSVTNTKCPLSSRYPNLRENNIQQGFLLCYHYRIVSIENCLSKIQNNTWYRKYTLDDLLSNDYPEIIDNTLKIKSTL